MKLSKNRMIVAIVSIGLAIILFIAAPINLLTAQNNVYVGTPFLLLDMGISALTLKKGKTLKVLLGVAWVF